MWDLEKYSVPLGIKIVLAWSTSRSAAWKHVVGWKEIGGGGGGGYNVRHYKQVWLDNPPAR